MPQKRDWKHCPHEWGKVVEIQDADFDVKFGEMRTCRLCGAIHHEDYTRMRAGSVERILPPPEDDA